MLVNNKPSYTVSTGGTYSPDTPIDINPDSISNSESSYRFVEPIGGGSNITDYVSKANGGVFDNLISYPSALSIVDDYNLVYKSWVDDAIDAKIAAIGAGTVSSITAGNGMNFSEITTSGVVTLGTPSTITLLTTNSLTSNSHTHAITGVQAALSGTGLVYSTAGVITYDTNTYVATTAFNGLFDARFTTNFAASSLTSLGTRNHANLNAIAGSSDGYHLSAGNYAIASRPATALQSGYLTDTDFVYFSGKLDSLTEGIGIDITAGVISTTASEIDHNSLLNYNIANHRTINDVGTANTDLWSASKIISYLSDANIVFTDITTNNSTTTKHGFLPKLSNDVTTFLNGRGEWITIPTTEDLDAPVITQIIDNTYNPGAVPANGDRYMILVSSSLHANFGTINKDLNGSTLVLQDNDIVQYVTSAGEFRIAFDASTATRNRMVLVETDIYLTDNANWAYSYYTDVWVYRGSSSSHNSLSGTQGGNVDYKYHLDDTQYALVTGITSSAAELNYLDGSSVTANRIIKGDGTKFTSDANFTFDGTTLYINGDVNIAVAKKYKINNVNLAYSDVGAQQSNANLSDVAALSPTHADILFVNGSSEIDLLSIGDVGKFLRSNGAGVNPSWETVSATPGGLTTQVQFNDGGTLNGISDFTFNKTTKVVSVTGHINTPLLKGNGLLLPHTIKKVASANVRNSHDDSISTSETVMTKLKTITLNNGLSGTIRISFRMMSAFAGENVRAEVRKNGTIIGSTQSTTAETMQSKSQDITVTFNPGDTCELWGKRDVISELVTVDQFRLSYDNTSDPTVDSTNS